MLINSSEAMTALEAKAEAESLEELHQERREIVSELAALEALHGMNGLWDDKRRSLRAAIATEIRDRMAAEGKKVTEGLIEDMAHADHRYTDFIDHGLADRMQYLQLKVRRDEIQERIRNRELTLTAYSAEARLR
jgi:hypothetical protein